MAEKLALKKALFDEIRKTNYEIAHATNVIEIEQLQKHKNFVQHIIEICVDRNKF